MCSVWMVIDLANHEVQNSAFELEADQNRCVKVTFSNYLCSVTEVKIAANMYTVSY